LDQHCSSLTNLKKYNYLKKPNQQIQFIRTEEEEEEEEETMHLK
jgi:hypothetical protein